MARLSMRELANKLGVDRATISRALSDDKSHLVAPATRERIRQAAHAAGYRPNLTAAALRRGISHTVGVLVPDLGNEMLVDIFRDIIRHLDRETGGPITTPLIAETVDDQDTTRRMVHTFLSRRVDAIVSLTSTELDREVLLEAAKEVPVVLAVRSLTGTGFPAALCDDRLGGALVAGHFADRGHRIVCQIAGPPLSATFKNRALGFSEVCRERGMIEAPPGLSARHATSAAGKEVFETILTADPRPTAVFAHNDALAIGAIEAMRQHGLNYPDDLAIAGFNNTQISRVLARPLTTIQYPIGEVSRHAGELVRRLIEDPDAEVESRSFAPSLIVRASS